MHFTLLLSIGNTRPDGILYIKAISGDIHAILHHSPQFYAVQFVVVVVVVDDPDDVDCSVWYSPRLHLIMILRLPFHSPVWPHSH